MKTSNLTKSRISEYLLEGKRFDNRGLLDYRDIEIELGVSNNAEGSAKTKIGDTEVIAGVKLEVVEPYPDSEDSGVLMTIMELLPLSSSRFEPGPPRIEAIEMARIVDRGIRESGFIDFKKLCIKKGEKVWGIFLDIYSISDGGNLLDAAFIAGIAALKNAKMLEYDEKNEKTERRLTNKGLPLTKSMPLTMTFHKIGKSIILDPIIEEEEASEARLSIAISKSDKGIVINAMQKGNESSLDKEEILEIIELGVKKWKGLYPRILEMIEKSEKERKLIKRKKK